MRTLRLWAIGFIIGLIIMTIVMNLIYNHDAHANSGPIEAQQPAKGGVAIPTKPPAKEVKAAPQTYKCVTVTGPDKCGKER